jgi:uncharacterized protein with ParB-like and HNH nuclease domain
MEAKQNSITKFMQQQDAQFFIPVYQRNYDWREEQCKQLLKDVFLVGSENKFDSHFIGSIVYIQLNLITGAPELTIIDGQQRLTTLTLFIAALAKRASEAGMVELAKKLSNRFLINEEMNDNEKLKLKPIKKDDFALKYILGLYHSEIHEFSRVIENYKYFYENITQDKIDLAYKGFQKLVFIEIALEKAKDDPQKIFQSLNSTGLDLSQSDLIRNYILMKLDNKTQIKIYEKYWIEIERNTTETFSKNSKMSDFIRDYLTFKFSSIPNQSKVFEVFREKYQFNNEEELSELLEDIKLYSRFYNYFINPDIAPYDTIKGNLRLIKKLQINVSYPFLLQVFKAHHDKIINENVINEVLEVIQSFTWRRFICGVATNALNKIFMDLYKSVDEENFVDSLYNNLASKRGSQRFPNDDEVLKELAIKDMYYIQSKNRTYFLERLENYGHRIQTTVENNPDVSIEHILPQKPSSGWKEQLNDEFEEMKKFVNTAANLTLSAFNSELSNSTFDVKRDYPDKGYIHSPLRIDKFLGSIDKWDISNLIQRRKWIEQRFLQIWKYPDVSVEGYDSSDDVNILDISFEIAKHRTIEYYIFFDEKYDNPSWQHLYKTVASVMFEREPDMFLETELKDKLKITINKDDLLRPIQISQSYFIESNYSAQDIVKRVQKILEICITDDELMIKIKNS